LGFSSDFPTITANANLLAATIEVAANNWALAATWLIS
jgi:hypothetical protein